LELLTLTGLTGCLFFEFMFFKVQRACSDLSETVMFIEKERFPFLYVATNTINKSDTASCDIEA